MKRVMSVLALVSMMLLGVGCGWQSPDPGHQVVLVKKPFIFGHGGVDDEPVATGLTFVALTTDGIDVNMQPQKYDVELDDIMTSDGVPITFHTAVVLQVTDSVKLIKTFGPKWYENNIQTPYQTFVRQAVRKHEMNETAISTTAIDAIDNEVAGELNQFLHDKGLPVQLVTLTVGKANPPDAIKNQRIHTAEQEQRINTEKQTALAEVQRAVAERNRADADNAYRQALGLSAEQFIELQKISMQRDACQHSTCIFGNGTALVQK